MLVLSRQRDQEIVITAGNEEIVVTLVEIRGQKARIGVSARRQVAVHRREIHEAIKRGEKPVAAGAKQ